MNWRTILGNPTLEAREKVKRIGNMLSLKYGEGRAMLYNGSAMIYAASGEGGRVFEGTELEELWVETKRLLDKESAKPKPRRDKKPSAAKEEDDKSSSSFYVDVEELFQTDINKMCGLGDRTEKTEGKLFVNDVIDMNELVSGKLNILYAHTGCGKTTFIEGPLKKYAEYFSRELLYLAPTCSIVESMNLRGEPKITRLRNGGKIVKCEQEGITVMTYAAFAHRITQERLKGTYCSWNWWNDDALICLDELDAAVKYSQFPGDNLHKTALAELIERCKNPNNTVVMLSATPRAAIDCFYFWNKVPINLIKSTCRLEGYKTEKIIGYNEIDNLLMSLDPTKRGVIYTQQIKDVKKFVGILNDRGIHAVGIWSTKSADHPMDEEQLRVRDALVKDEMIAEGVQVLVFNASYEAGINIKPEKSHIDYVVVNNSNSDTIIQARGRYRGDLDTLYRKKDPNELEGEVREIDEEVLRPYLGKRLEKAEKNEIREKLNFKNKKNRLMSWPELAEHIRGNGYLVIEKKSGSKRWHVIQRKAREA